MFNERSVTGARVAEFEAHTVQGALLFFQRSDQSKDNGKGKQEEEDQEKEDEDYDDTAADEQENLPGGKDKK